MEMRKSRQGWNPIRAEGDDGNCSSRTRKRKQVKPESASLLRDGIIIRKCSNFVL